MQTPKWKVGTNLCRLRSWDDFENELANYLRLLQEKGDRHIVITWTKLTRYVQFASLKNGSIDGEATSNHYLKENERLTPASCRSLVHIGWRRPDASETSKKNFWRRWPAPVPANDIVVLAVKTLRDVFEIPTPSELEIRFGSFASLSVARSLSSTLLVETGEWALPSKNPTLQLPLGSIVNNANGGRGYKVGEMLGAGGFGAVYRVDQVVGPEPLEGECVLKVSVEPGAWHREAYFGDLLSQVSGFVRVHESFAWVPRSKDRKPVYCLVSEFVKGGDLNHYFEEHPEPWSESKARREIMRLLHAVTLLHASGAVHRDITPNNVFVGPDHVLKLGDFGIALHRIGGRDVKADAFNFWFAPPAIKARKAVSWRPADDVYHLGQLFAVLLNGAGKSKFTTGEVKSLACSPRAKSVIQRCIGERRKRFANAREMLIALNKQESVAAKRVIVRSLKDKRVVFTGSLTILRHDAKSLLKEAGGFAEKNVGALTDVVVVGDQSPHWKAEKKGQKLLDLERERERGHHIAVIKEGRFKKLAQSHG